MSYELVRNTLWSSITKAYQWIKNEFLNNKRESVPVLLGLGLMILSTVVPASSSVFLWWFENWGTYIGAGLIAYGIYPRFSNLSDDDEPTAPPHREDH